MKKEDLVHVFDWSEIGRLARKTVAEGCVLIKNENEALPINKGEKVAVFGRSQFNYYKSGTGSGGAVNAPYVVGILDALCEDEEQGNITIDKNVKKAYEDWLVDNPFEIGEGWAAEPWNQVEMMLSDELVMEAAKNNDIAIYIVGRTAGEDQDNRVAAGSYLLTETEEKSLALVTKYFKRTAVILNTGNIIDMKWMNIINPQAVMYVWQGGMVGGLGVADILLGRENPSGCLSDTIAEYMNDYPSSANFGFDDRDFYAEDIYVGYRYFETFAKDKVLYPFGYGLSYTTFEISNSNVISSEEDIQFSFEVKNTGKCAGAHVVQLYVSKPQGALGKPGKELVGFAKTKVIEPGESEKVSISVSFNALASYDDSGVTGFPFSFVVEKGEYIFYAGKNVRDAENVYSVLINDTVVVEKLESALAPVLEFDRMRPKQTDDGSFELVYEKTPTRGYDLKKRIADNRPDCLSYAGDLGIKLADVYEENADIDKFLSQLTDDDLIYISRGEGMCSPKVTAGTASAFGGVTDSLRAFGIPLGCCADGPSGIRMDCGTSAFSMPNGTLLACTFNTALVEELYEMEGMDLRRNKVDLLLGPGINMHRHPLNGRNFEYFSEDPYLTGIMAVAQLKGMGKQGVSGTIKHFAGNEQEWKRHSVDSVVSERALREIYLKPFEMAVKQGGAFSVMTTYGSLNGQWTAGNYDLVTTILRKEWGFNGIAMTDWWASINEEGEPASKENTVPMVRAQNDLYMVVTDSFTNTGNDNSVLGLAEGKITRGELVRNAKNICKVLMKLPCMKREISGASENWTETGLPESAIEKVAWSTSVEVDRNADIDITDLPTKKGDVDIIDVTFKDKGFYKLIFEMSSTASELAQMPLSVYNGPALLGTISIHGTKGEIVEKSVDLAAEVVLSATIKLKFGMTGIDIHSIRIEFDKESRYR